MFSQKSVEAKPIDTQKELAKADGVSHDTIHKVEVIEKESGPYLNISPPRWTVSARGELNSLCPTNTNENH